MTTFNTGNRLGSNAPKDLYDNAENLDNGINGTAKTWTDRLGVVRKSWSGIETDFQQFLADGSTIEFPTWAAASAAAGAGQIPLNRQVSVIGDTGSHLDPVSGFSVPNSGRYVMAVAGLEWRSADVVSQKQDRQGLSEIFDSPNLYLDTAFVHMIAAQTGSGFVPGDGSGTFTRGAGAALALTTSDDGRPAFSLTVASTSSPFCRWSQTLSGLKLSPGDEVSASVRVLGGTVVGVARVQLQQFNSAGAEITSARRSMSFTTGPLVSTPVEFSKVLLDASAASVGIYVDGNSVGTVIRLTDYLFAKGAVAKFRPPIAGRVLDSQAAAGVARSVVGQSMSDASENPNLIAPSTFDFTMLAPLASGAAEATTYGGKRCWKITDPSPGSPEEAVAIGRFPAGRFRGKVSAGVFIVAVEAGSAGSGARVLLRQFNGNVEITAVRRTQQLGTGGSAVGETQVSFNDVAVDPSATSVELYIAVLSGDTGTRSLYFREPSVRPGGSAAWVSSSASAAVPLTQAHVAPTGSDSSVGSANAPLATISAALNAIGGDGVIYLHPGMYGEAQRFAPRLVTGSVKIIGVREGLSSGAYSWPTVLLGTRVIGITKTPGRSKVYQAAVSGLPALADFQWAYQHGVEDPTTAIDGEYRFPQHRGRTHRLPDCAKLVKTSAVVLADALAEIDSSSSPKSFVEAGVMYFSISGGGDGSAAEVYLDAAGLVLPDVAGVAGSLSVVGLNVMYGGLNLAPFAESELDEVRVVGSKVNAVDYNVLRYGRLEVCCAGSQSQSVGDGLNGHFGAVVVGAGDLYSHDNWDDGFSDHEGCSSRLTGGGLVEYNGGTGIAPAYGSDSLARGFISVRNQRRGTHKAAAFYVTGAPSGGTPPETGADTNGVFQGCVDFESLTSFADDYTLSNGAQPVTATCIDCKSVRPATRGYNVRKAVDCSYTASGTSTARNASTVVERSSPLSP